MASDVLRRSDSMAVGAGLWSEFRLRKDDRLNLEWDLSRDMERSLPLRGGGGGNCGLDVMLVALEGTTTELGRLAT